MPPQDNVIPKQPGSEVPPQSRQAAEMPPHPMPETKPLTEEELEQLRKGEKESQPAGQASEIQTPPADNVAATEIPIELQAEQNTKPIESKPAEVSSGPVDPVVAYEGIDMSDPAYAVEARNKMSATKLHELGVDVSED